MGLLTFDRNFLGAMAIGRGIILSSLESGSIFLKQLGFFVILVDFGYTI